jgi:hypothetical protein
MKIIFPSIIENSFYNNSLKTKPASFDSLHLHEHDVVICREYNSELSPSVISLVYALVLWTTAFKKKHGHQHFLVNFPMDLLGN